MAQATSPATTSRKRLPSSAAFSEKLARGIAEQPHLLGHLLGYRDLGPIHSAWITRTWRATTDYVLQAFRGSYKTTSVIVVGSIWYHLYNPEARILLVREDYGNAVATLAEITRHYEREDLRALYRLLYGITNFRLRIKRGNSITLPTKRRVTKEGSLEAIGIGGSITGRHYERIHCDDVVTMRDRVSKAKREQAKAFLRELINLPMPGGVISHTGTPWHKDDAFSILPEPERWPLGSPGMDIPGYTEDRIATLKKGLTPGLFASQYELRHISDHDRILGDVKMAPWPAGAQPLAWVDPAYTGTDTTALVLIAKYQDQIWARGWVWREDIMAICPRIARILIDYKAGTTYVDTTGDKGMSANELRRYYPAVVARTEALNKHIKIISYARPKWGEVLWAEDCQPEFIAQAQEYQEGEDPDDAADAFACLVREMRLTKGLDVLGRFT